jgi:2-keto-4-pentenoate hydratase/2-oxohepta-3-ene-1,7-dioic acid hydratase in catechol pathway
MIDVLADWEATARTLRAQDSADTDPLTDARLVAPLTYPSKVVCAGANYTDHMAEMGLPTPEGEPRPYFFLKPPTTTVIGPDEPIPMPPGEDVRLDFEAELAVVIAHRVRDIDASDALAHVAGYTVANDVSARGRFRRADPLGPPFAFDWIGHKGQDGFCPLGPGIVPVWEVAEPGRLAVRTWVDGELRQDSSTACMLVPIAAQIAAVSQQLTLEPGDVLLTGTPAGVGAGNGRFLDVGAEIRIEIEGLGVLRNRVVRSNTSTVNQYRGSGR